MAERLAPERTPLEISSQPEQRRGSRLRWTRRLLALGSALVVAAALAVATAYVLLVDRGARELRATSLVAPDQPVSALVVVARPGQEVLMAGTVRALTDAGARVSMLSLTRGEGQPPLLEADRLAGLRADEFADSAQHLGVDSATTAAFPDGGLVAADPAAVIRTISEAIAAASPSVILTVGDLTGSDTDSRATTSYVQSAALAVGSGVGRVWVVTRGEREADWTARLGETDAAQRPTPDAAVRIAPNALAKGESLAAHGTQSPRLAASTYPLADRLPAWAYFHFLDREYFHLQWGEPLA